MWTVFIANKFSFIFLYLLAPSYFDSLLPGHLPLIDEELLLLSLLLLLLSLLFYRYFSIIVIIYYY